MEPVNKMEQRRPGIDEEVSSAENRGGWVTSPFIIGTLLALVVAAGGWYFNLIVFLLNEFNMKSIQAAQMSNITGGFFAASPIIGAILADSFFDEFVIVLISSLISMLGLAMFIIMVTVSSLRPPPCTNNTGSTACMPPSSAQMVFLYVALALGIIGVGGTRTVLQSLGVYQLNKTKDQGVLINWLVFTSFIGYAIGYLVIVYLETDVSWALGLGISMGLNLIAVALILSGKPFFRTTKRPGSPFTGIARVLVATFWKLRAPAVLSEESECDCYHYDDPRSKIVHGPPTATLRFLNRAAIKGLDDTDTVVSTKNWEKSWKTCSVEEVEDLKKLIKILPIWLFGIFYNTPIGMINSFVVLQALVMDRHIGQHFKIPPASFMVFTLVSSCITIAILDRFLYPLWSKLFGREMTPLKRIGIGHVCTIIAMIVAAVTEKKRLDLVNNSLNLTMEKQGAVAPMSALWLAFPLAIVGVGEAFEVPGETAFNYQEFPRKLRSTSFAIGLLRIAIAFYISAAIPSLLQRATSWLPNDINNGRLDIVFWMLGGIGFVNFICFVVYAIFYKYNNLSMEEEA